MGGKLQSPALKFEVPIHHSDFHTLTLPFATGGTSYFQRWPHDVNHEYCPTWMKNLGILSCFFSGCPSVINKGFYSILKKMLCFIHNFILKSKKSFTGQNESKSIVGEG